MPPPIPRSYLFVPAHRPDRIAKAFASGAHAVIVDLEDAVPPAEKTSARNAAAAALNMEHPVLIRVNGADTPWFRDDLALCRHPGVAGIVLPKAERIDDISQVESAGATRTILPLIETALGMVNAQALAQARCVQRLMFGSIDFKLDLGLEGDDDSLLFYRSQLVLASRLAGILAPVDGVTLSIDDLDQVRSDATRARRDGFGAKLCIHPKQVDLVNRCFSPGAEETAWARRVVEAAAAADGAAIALDGKMVDRPVILKAQRILEEAGRQTVEGHS